MSVASCGCCGGCGCCCCCGSCGGCCCGSGGGCCGCGCGTGGGGCDGGCGGGCWAWMVVFACFCVSFLVDGVCSCFGVLLPELATQISSTIADTAWAGSALCGGQLVAGPLVSALVNKLGCRTVVILGSLVSSVAFSLSASASEIGLFIFMYGIVGGIGLGMMYLPSVVAVSIYFDRKRALATGIAACGSGVGTFCLAPLTQHLLEVYGWRGVQMATAALLLTGLIFGGMMAVPASVPGRCRSCCDPQTKTQKSDTPAQAGVEGCQSALTEEEEGPPIPTRAEDDQSTPADAEGDQPTPVGMKQDQPTVASMEGCQVTPSVPGISVESTLPAAHTGSYVKMASPVVPAAAEEVLVESGSSAVLPPRSAFLFPEVVVESVSSDSAGEVSGESLSVSQHGPHLKDHGREIIASGSLEEKTLSHRDLAQSRFQLLSPRRRLSCLSCAQPGLLLPPSGLLSPRPAVSTPRQVPLSPHTPATGRGRAPAQLRPFDRPDVLFSGRVQPVARRPPRLPPGGVPASPSSLPSAPAGPGCLDSDVQRRLALGSAASMDTMVLGESPPVQDRVSGDSFSVLREMLDLSLLRETPFLLTCLGYSLSMLGYFVPIVYILDEAVQHGVEPVHASLLVAVLGASNTVGRLLVGLLSSLQHMDVLLLNNASMLGSGVVALLFPLCQTYTAYAATAAIFSLLAAANSTLSSLVLLEMVGLERLTNAFGLTLLFRGVAAILGTPLAGFVAEKTGSYDEPFYMTGCLLMVSSLLGFVATSWSNSSCRPKRRHDTHSYKGAEPVDIGDT